MVEFLTLDESVLEELFKSDQSYILFKHSYRCSVSSMAQNRLLIGLDTLEQPVYLVDVIGQRTLSHYIASLTGIQHESPQVLVMKGQSVVHHASHFGIEADSILKITST